MVGRLKQDRWTDQEGKGHSKVYIVAEHVEFKPQLKKEGDAGAEEERPAEGAEEGLEEVKEAASF
jgi:single-strand DNA-binding protein